MNNEQRREKLKELTSKYRETFYQVAKETWDHHVNNLPPSQAVPPKGSIYGDENRQKFNDTCNALKSEARDILGEVKAEVNDMMTAAPSTEAVNTINMLKLRGNVSEDEFVRIMDKYGSDNYQTAKALSHIAHEQGIRALVGCDAALDGYLADLDGIEHGFGCFSVKDAEQGGVEGKLSILDAQIDAAFPDE